VGRAIKEVAILIGLSPENNCVYSASLSLGDYWDGLHLWDDSRKLKRARLERLRGFLFGAKGELL
jgi:hypothetical protein